MNDPFKMDPDMPIEDNIDLLSNLDKKHDNLSDFGDNLQIKGQKSSLTMKQDQ